MGAKSTGSHPTTTKADGHLLEYFRNTFVQGGGSDVQGPITGVVATGGVISDYTSGSKVYRAHIFTNSGTFDVSSIGTLPSSVEYLVVAGGGSGGRTGSGYGAGGGGAGGFRTNLTGHPLAGGGLSVSASPGSYTITVGAGGAGASGPGDVPGNKGGTSSFAGPDITTITSTGGGGGSRNNPAPANCTGGSGGGGYNSYAGGPGNNPPVSPAQGFAGGTGSPEGGAGGGGATGSGGSGSTPTGGAGGTGSNIDIVGFTTHYAVGGGGVSRTSPHNSPIDPHGVGGRGGQTTASTSGRFSTGGGGGARRGDNAGLTGAGGSGIVVVRYQIGTLQTSDAKASGGLISFYNNKTIHAFTSSGTFATNPGFNETVEYFMVAGGGGGGGSSGGGGGAGGYLTGTTPVAHPAPLTVIVGAGGEGDHTNGVDTSVNFPAGTLTAAGGGRGGGNQPSLSVNTPGLPGGSGGGSRNQSSNQGSGNQYGPTSPLNPAPAPGQGNNGAAGAFNPTIRGGGGGGAGGAGSSAVGGIGVQAPATFRDPSSEYGDPAPGAPSPGGFYFAGGGGAGSSYSEPNTAGGHGGGGDGGSQAIGTAAMTNTGGGGGGGGYTPLDHRGASGGSGIVLIAYPT